MVRQKSKRQTFIVLIVVFLLAIVAVVVLNLTNTLHWFSKASPVVRAPSKPITQLPTTSKPASGSASSTTSPSSSSATTDGVNQGNDIDKNGQIPTNVSTDPSDWSTSASKLITVKAPQENSTFTSGSVLAGSASVDKVQYTLIDDQLGVISQGFIKVVNGNFSAAINFSSHTTTGRLDVFSTSSTGKELNEVQIDVTF